MFVLRCWIIRRFPTRLSGPKRLLVHIDSTLLGRRIADRDDVYRAIAQSMIFCGCTAANERASPVYLVSVLTAANPVQGQGPGMCTGLRPCIHHFQLRRSRGSSLVLGNPYFKVDNRVRSGLLQPAVGRMRLSQAYYWNLGEKIFRQRRSCRT